MAHSVNVPVGVIRPILLPVLVLFGEPEIAVGAVVIPYGPELVVGTVYS